MAKLLLKNGANPNIADFGKGAEAARKGLKVFVKHLNEAGAELDTADTNSRTQIFKAVGTGHSDAVNLFLFTVQLLTCQIPGEKLHYLRPSRKLTDMWSRYALNLGQSVKEYFQVTFEDI